MEFEMFENVIEFSVQRGEISVKRQNYPQTNLYMNKILKPNTSI